MQGKSQIFLVATAFRKRGKRDSNRGHVNDLGKKVKKKTNSKKGGEGGRRRCINVVTPSC